MDIILIEEQFMIGADRASEEDPTVLDQSGALLGTGLTIKLSSTKENFNQQNCLQKYANSPLCSPSQVSQNEKEYLPSFIEYDIQGYEL